MDAAFKRLYDALFDEYKSQFATWVFAAAEDPWKLVIGSFTINVGDEELPLGCIRTLVLSNGVDVVHECRACGCFCNVPGDVTTSDALRLAKMLRDKERDVESKTPV